MIINLTQHKATPEQVAAGVIELAPVQREELTRLLTFEELPSFEELYERAEKIAKLPGVRSCAQAMIGGAPFFMEPLTQVLRVFGIRTVFAFSRRVSVESTAADGSVTKTAIFRHEGFVEL